MKYRSIFVIIFSLSCNIIFANNIKLVINGYENKSIVIFSVKGEKSTPIDTIFVNTEREFSFNFNKQNISGLYRAVLLNTTWLDFIYDNEDIEIYTDVNHLLDSVKVIKSKSNTLFYEFIKLNKEYKTKNELLQFIIDRYPQTDPYYYTTVKTLTKLQDEYLYFVNLAVLENQGKFISKYVKSSQLPILPTHLTNIEKINYLKCNALDNVDFNDESLINSDVFINKAIEYLTYFSNPKLQKHELEKEFMKAVDTILSKAKINKNVYTCIVEYYIKGFREYNFDIIITYMLDNYVLKDDLCIDEKLEIALERRINQSKMFKAGNKVPNIILPDRNSKNINLYNIDADEILIIFYSTTCPHCITQIPKIYEYYKKQDKAKFKVLAISLDTSKEEWLNFIDKNNLDWINVNDFTGWNSKVVSDYSIYATPTFFILDKDKNVVSIPVEFPVNK